MAGITINPALVTNAAGSFSTNTTGYVQGVLLDDPVKRYSLLSGIVSPSASSPMWGGVGVTVSLTTAGTEASEIGAVLTPATSQANLNGFTVFNQSAAMIQSPQSPVPLAPASGAINYVLLGSDARITVACSNAVATALAGGAINQAVYWDYTNQVLLNAPGGTAIPVKVVDVNIGNSQVVTYNSGTGFATWTRSGSSASTVVIEI
ncbi:MAG TPA: hypothetical protein VI653_04990 [Steroidobacteraceae bacterium]